MRLAAAAFLCASGGWAADWKELQPQGYLSDFAHAVDGASRRDLNTYCQALEQTTGAHLSIVVIDSLHKEPVDDVARAIFNNWAVGKPSPENRALLLVAIVNRKDSLVAGSALQPILNTDSANDLLADARPALGDQRYGQALMAAAEDIGKRVAAARGKTMAVTLPKRARRTLRDSIPWPLIAGGVPILALLVWLLRRPHHGQLPGQTPPQPPAAPGPPDSSPPPDAPQSSPPQEQA